MSSKKDMNANINTARQQHTNVGTLLYRHVTFTTQYTAILLPCSMLTPVIALPDILPNCNLQHVCRLGSKYRPIVSDSSPVIDQDTRRCILAMLRPAIEGFARSAEGRICMHNSMQAWVEEVMSQLSHALDDIPDGTSLHPPGALPCTHDDEVAMQLQGPWGGVHLHG